MPGFGVAPYYATDVYRYAEAARKCDELAGKLEETLGKIRQVQSQTRAAWTGDSGRSLDSAITDDYWYLLTAANMLRSAAGRLRACKEAHKD
jgi:uncharacterized protein YukE